MHLAISGSSADEAQRIDFNPQDPTLEWHIVNDTVMGGRSSSHFNTDGGVLQFTGTLQTRGGGFASVRSSQQPWDLSDVSLIRLKVRGDGRVYRFRLFPASERISYQSEFQSRTDQWQIIELPLDNFYASKRGRTLRRPPIYPGDIAGFGFILADGTDGAFRLTVDWIELVSQTGKVSG